MLDLRIIRELLDRHGEALSHRVKSFEVGGRLWDCGKTPPYGTLSATCSDVPKRR